MPNEVISTVATSQPWDWCSKTLLTIISLFVLGSMARTLVSPQPFDKRKFVGEIIFSTICAIAMYSMGMMQGMSEIQIVGFGAFASLGGVRSFEWALRVANQVKSGNAKD